MSRHMMRVLQVMNAVSLALFLLSCLHSMQSMAVPSDGAMTVVQEADNGEATVEVEGENKVTDQKEPGEVFIPTHEWQEVKEGQSVPAGLHISMSLQSGKKMAKLMDGDSGERYQTSHDQIEDQVNADKKQFSVDELKRALKDFKATELDQPNLEREQEVKAKFRSYNELKKDFEEMNMKIETDGEIITKIVEKLNSSEPSREEQIAMMRDLEYYLHQYDNGIYFMDLGGLPLILKAVNNSKDTELQIEGAMVLGTAASLNPKVQVGVIEAGGLQMLLPILATSPSDDVQRKMLFALSAICRQFPFAQKRFLELGGLSAVRGLMKDNTSVRLRIRALTFLLDLLTEKINVEEQTDSDNPIEMERLGQYQQVSLKEAMLEQGWCELIPGLLQAPEHDSRDKVLLAMRMLGTECRKNFRREVGTLVELKSEYTQLAKTEAETEDEDKYFAGLLSVVNELLDRFEIKDEL